VAPEFAMSLAWIVWAASWFAAAVWSDRTVKRPGAGRELGYRLLTITGAVLLFGRHPGEYSSEWLSWLVGSGVSWAMVALAVIGFLFAWWARIYLGRLWSGTVTRKADHHLIETGPYALVRHPIYTGLLLSTLATAVQRGRISALVGLALMTLGWYVKAGLEERFLREQLGPDEYDAYAERVPMLVPFVRL
jgi:protein-S-isoprenylcysteine O-methyltransferase Ste14